MPPYLHVYITITKENISHNSFSDSDLAKNIHFWLIDFSPYVSNKYTYYFFSNFSDVPIFKMRIFAYCFLLLN